MGESDAGPVICWFRRDLRLNDNPALAAAARTNRPMVPVYVHDQRLEGRPIGAAARVRLDASLRALDASLRAIGSRLVLRRGDCAAELGRLVAETGARGVLWNRLPEPEATARDEALQRRLQAEGVTVETFEAFLLAPAGSVRTGAGEPYRVFTPFARALRPRLEHLETYAAPSRLRGPDVWPASKARAGPGRPDWSRGFDLADAGEAGGLARLADFLDRALPAYPAARDRPDLDGTTRLSAHLHFGEIGPARVVRAALEAARRQGAEAAAEKLISELIWREFNWSLLYAFPELPTQSLRPGVEPRWRRDPEGFAAWTKGLTGYPLVDAGMRQLWVTGWMHNRVRMVAASFLIKHLLIDWREGEAWFWDTLVDADEANNPANWQWAAGSGADAQPFFRIFNPVSQGERFDPVGAYVKRWVPELRDLPAAAVHRPWDAGGVKGYPPPIVEHAMARARALEAFKALRAE
jgi:deoxyribodipyrimidine photo-lyase